ncbi:Dot/Icm T4SS effector AnkY/LegA9 [uncultured Legionella sp.]|uniref:Dot/Icm T4SS effector AnkY/LegA9 n=1 Tax=uncultured Legionella sp. TaxID=210934 RepID=UPI002603D2C9|nr:Dot/Icm T4SS effector AnkY/LegA9 [uncultured Legionella sp.]
MPKIILVYANCVNDTAKGDFTFAGKIATDLINTVTSGGLNFDVVLTSTLDGMTRFEQLYGNPVNGRVDIEGSSVGMCALELFDPVNDEVVAFIESNRCKYPAADILRRVLSPDSKFLFIGAANQPVISGSLMQHFLFNKFQKEQPHLYSHFDANDVMMGRCGIGPGRLGLPQIKTVAELPALTLEQSIKIPTGAYGFMYLTSGDKSADLRTIGQYVALTELSRYVLVGDYSSSPPTEIKKAIIKELHFNGSSMLELPQMFYHQSLSNGLMRNMVAGVPGNLVLSTGTMSTLEAMNDGKLPYYQTSSNNTEFVVSYLLAVKNIISSDSSLVDASFIMELSELLFADKPLAPSQMERTKELVNNASVTEGLLKTNQQIIKSANGTLAGQLLSFIGTPVHTQLHRQCVSVCQSLRKYGELSTPLYDQALRRAAAWGRLFELKVMIKSMNVDDLSKQDLSGKKFTALHWAVIQGHADCARQLIVSGAQLNIQDIYGKTPLHYAIQAGAREAIKVLVNNGASLDIADSIGEKPCDKAESWIPAFILDCLSKDHVKMNFVPTQ